MGMDSGHFSSLIPFPLWCPQAESLLCSIGSSLNMFQGSAELTVTDFSPHLLQGSYFLKHRFGATVF